MGERQWIVGLVCHTMAHGIRSICYCKILCLRCDLNCQQASKLRAKSKLWLLNQNWYSGLCSHTRNIFSTTYLHFIRWIYHIKANFTTLPVYISTLQTYIIIITLIKPCKLFQESRLVTGSDFLLGRLQTSKRTKQQRVIPEVNNRE